MCDACQSANYDLKLLELPPAAKRVKVRESHSQAQVICIKVSSQSTNDTNEQLQVLIDVVVLGCHPTSMVKDREVGHSFTNAQVDRISHERMSGKVKASHVGKLDHQSSLYHSICRIWTIPVVTLDPIRTAKCHLRHQTC